MGQLTKVLDELELIYKQRDVYQSLCKSCADWEQVGLYNIEIDQCNLYIEVLWNSIDQLTKKGTEVPFD